MVSRRARSSPSSTTEALSDPLRHHGDVEVRGAGLLDLAVNVYPGPRPLWLDQALRASLDEVGSYPSADRAEAAIAQRHGIDTDAVLATAGAAEAFTLLARARPWRRPVVVHPQFTEPHAALEQAGHTVTEVVLPEPFVLDPGLVPDDADLVMVGNPTNPTGVLHPAETLRALTRPGRLVVVDEAFIDTVPGEAETVVGEPGFVVVRSLTKHWSIPGVRAGYLTGPADLIADLRREQSPWSVSTMAAAAIRACSTGGRAGRVRAPCGGDRRVAARADRRAGRASASRMSPRAPRSSWPTSARVGTRRCAGPGSPYDGPTPSRDWTDPGCGSRSGRLTRPTGC